MFNICGFLYSLLEALYIFLGGGLCIDSLYGAMYSLLGLVDFLGLCILFWGFI